MSEHPDSGLNLKILATRLFFLVLGVCSAIVAPLIPVLKTRYGAEDDVLGGILLMLGIGSVLTMPWSGVMCRRFGLRSVMIMSGSLLGVSVTLVTFAPSPFFAVAFFLLMGGSMGVLDVSMNLHAVEMETATGKPLMSGFHGFYSLGGFVGALLISLIMGFSGEIKHSGLGVSLFCGLIVALGGRFLISQIRTGLEESKRPSFPFAVLLIGTLCAVTFASEGSVGDWSGLVIQTKALGSKETLGYGYAAFAAAMTLGRLTGDRLRARLGDLRCSVGGGIICATGFLIVGLSSSLVSIVAGFALVGLGAANIVPVLFSAASRLPGVPSETAIASVTTMGYAGFLVCPPLLGLISKSISLSYSVLLVAVSMAVLTLLLPKALSQSDR
jgi:MFS family permease